MENSLATRPASIRWKHFAGISLLSFATLLLELSLTRVLSVASWYHFGFLVISTALLGFGVSGVVLSLWKSLRESIPLDPALSVISLLFGFVTVVSFSLMQMIPFQPFELLNDHKQFIYMLLYYVMLAGPFFCSGLAISLLLTRGGRAVNGLYAADMVGGGIACVAVCLTMPMFGGSGSVVVAALFGTLAALTFNSFRLSKLTLIGSLTVVGMLVLAFFAEHALPIVVNPGKRLHPLFPQQTSPIYTKWNSFSKIDVYPAPKLDPSRPDPGFYSIIIDGGTAGTGMGDLSMGVRTYLANPSYHPAGVAYVGKTKPKVLIIGSGAGREVLEALYYGASSVTAVEVNPIITDVVTKHLREHWGGLFEQPEVHLVNDEGRSFVRRSHELYDVIISVDTYSGTALASGALTLSESYILTREAFEDYWNHLTPNGVVLVTGYDTTKLISTARAMSDELGVSDPANHLFVYMGLGAAFGQANLNSGFVLQKSPLSREEVAEMARRAGINGGNRPQDQRSPTILYSPFAEPHDQRQTLLADLAKSPDPEKVYARVDTYVNPATDDRPFFHQTQRWGLHTLGFRKYFEGGFYTARNAQVTLVVLLIQSLIVAGVMILLPMVRFNRSALRAKGCATLLVYFASLGVGFIFIEIIFLQRFQLFLGPPIYTFSVVLAGLLTFTGLGSFAANGFRTASHRLLSWLLLAVVGILALELFVMPVIFNWALGFALAWRVAVSIALLAPVGLLLGMPFPIGLRLFGEEDSLLVPWAWAINAFFSVIGSVSAMILGMILGFTAVEIISAACYGTALVAIAIRTVQLPTLIQPSVAPQIAYSIPYSAEREEFGIANSNVSAPGGASIPNRTTSAKEGLFTPLASEEHERVMSNLKRIAQDLNLTEQQMERLQSAMGQAREEVTQYIKHDPNATRADIIAKVKEHRVEVRQRVENFLSLEQLAKWDAEMTKAKEFLGQKLEV